MKTIFILHCVLYIIVFWYHVYISRLPHATVLEMVVPAHALGKVMGKGGANLDNIRKVGYF